MVEEIGYDYRQQEGSQVYEGFYDVDKIPLDNAQNILFSSSEMLEAVLTDFNQNKYSPGEWLDQYKTTYYCLYPWFMYGTQRAQGEDMMSMDEAKTYAHLTTYLIEALQVKEMKSGPKQGRSFNPSEHIFHSKYGRQREYPFQYPFLGYRVASDMVLTNKEISFVLYNADCSSRMATTNDFEQYIWGKRQANEEGQDIYITDPFPSYKAFQLWYEHMHTSIRMNGLPLPVRVGVHVKLSENIGLLIATDTQKFYSVGLFPEYNGVGMQTSHVPPVEVMEAKALSGEWKEKGSISIDKEVAHRQEQLRYVVRLITDSDLRKEMEAISTQNFAHVSPEDMFRTIIDGNRDRFEPWEWNVLRKKLVKLKTYDEKSPIQRHRIQEKILTRHTEHYKGLLADIESGVEPSDVYFTRSGLSANLTAMGIAESLLGESLRVSELDGWYYENLAPETWPKSDTIDANVLLVATDPNSPQRIRDEKEYRQYRDTHIETFMRQARLHSDKPFVMVVDKTTDLLEHAIAKRDIPQNMMVIETASITKHQRGAQANFLGVMALWSDVDSRIVQSNILKATGTLTPDDMFALPRLTRTELKRNNRHFQKLSTIFAAELSKAQRTVPQKYRWVWQPYTMYGFLLPSQHVLQSHNATKDYDWFIHSGNIEDAIYRYIHNNQDVRVSKGDGFGLPESRCTRFGVGYPDSKSKKFILNVMRFGFGTETSEVEFRDFCRTILTELSNQTKSRV